MSDTTMIRQAQSAQERALKLKSMGKLDEAREQLDSFVVQFAAPSTPEGRKTVAEVQYTLGEVLEKLGDRTNAITAWKRALEHDPQHRRASAKIVEVGIAAGERATPDLAPRYLDYLSWGADRRIKKECLKRLKALLRIEADTDPSTITWQLPILQSLTESWPNVSFARLALARAHYLRGDFRQSIPYLREAMSLDPRSLSVMNMLGRAYEKVGHLDEARDVYLRSLEVDDKQGGIHFRLGRILLAGAVKKS